MPRKGQRGNTQRNTQRELLPQNITFPAAMERQKWGPGQSGNPSGRPKTKFLTKMLLDLLYSIDKTDKQGLQHAQKLVRELYDRAMRSSDYLMIEILNRAEGKLAPDTEQERASDRDYQIVMVDVPRPARPTLPPAAVHGVGQPKPDPKDDQ
jgi:Family of unknown function (DUF5681)